MDANFILVLERRHIVCSLKRKWHGGGFIITLVPVLLNFLSSIAAYQYIDTRPSCAIRTAEQLVFDV